MQQAEGVSDAGPKALCVYFGGEIFTAKHLAGNAALAEAVNRVSHARYRAILPQDIEQHSLEPRSIRDTDIRALWACDAAVFQFDGSEIDSGTVAEFVLSRMIDLPSVLLRSDFRQGGDQEDEPWNLMLSFYPRTKPVLINSMAVYKKALLQGHMLESLDIEIGIEDRRQTALKTLMQSTAKAVVLALDEVVGMEPILTPEERGEAMERAFRLVGVHAVDVGMQEK